jgi:hypothetical protein
MAAPKNPKGRPKGAKDKLGRTVKEAIEFAAQRIGGPQRLAAWIKEDPDNEKAFWTSIYPKLLPLQVTGEGGGPIEYAQVLFNPVGNGSTDKN